MQLRKWFIGFLGVVGLVIPLAAQTTTITATITDSDSQVWSGMKWRVTFVPNPSYPNLNNYVIASTGAPINRSIANPDPGVADGTGTFSVTVYDNTAIQPAGSSYTFTLCAKTVAPCSVISNISVNGATENLSSTLSSLVTTPRFAAVSGAYGYNDTEVFPTPLPGGRYFNVVSNVTREWNGTTWQTLGPGGGPPCATNTTVQISTSGALNCDPNITINTTTHTQDIATGSNGAYTAPFIGGIGYATHFGDGATNGILQCFNNASTCIADPTYAITEQYTPSTLPCNFCNFQDYRQQRWTNYYHNWLDTPLFGDPRSSAINLGFLVDQNPSTQPAAQSTSKYGVSLIFTDNNPGWNVGNPPGAPKGGWYVPVPLFINHTIRGATLAESIGLVQTKYSEGDNAPIYPNVYGRGGQVDASGEGAKALADGTTELTTPYLGTAVTGGTLTSPTTIKTTIGANGAVMGDGLPIIDTTAGPVYSGHFTNIDNSGCGGGCSNITVDFTVPISNAIGSLVGECAPNPIITVYPFTQTITCNVNISSGTPVVGVASTLTGIACIGGTTYECTYPTVVAFVSGTTWAITMPIHKPHGTGSVFEQGGAAGLAWDATDYRGIVSSNLRYLQYVVGSTTANIVQVVSLAGNGTQVSKNGAPDYQFINLSNISNSAATPTLINATYVVTGSTLNAPISRNKSPWKISGSSDSAFNTTCTNGVWLSPVQFQCTIAGLTGSHTAATATASPGNNDVAIYGTADVWDVQDYIQGASNCVLPTIAPCVDGTLVPNPSNTLVVHNGDTIEQPNHQSAIFTGFSTFVINHNPWAFGNGVVITANGLTGGNNSVSSNAFVKINALGGGDTTYVGGGGNTVNPANILNEQGPYSYGYVHSEGPSASGGSLIYSFTTAAQQADPNYIFGEIFTQGNGGNFSLTYAPHSNNIVMSGGAIRLLGSNTILDGPLSKTSASDNFQGLALTVPVNGTPVKMIGGGTFPDATQECFRVYAKNTAGSGVASAETCITTDSSGLNTNSILWSWSRIPGATQYIICRGATGAEGFITTINGVDVLTYLDNNSITPSGNCTQADSSLPNMGPFNSYILQGSTSKTNVTLKANAAQGTQIVTLPSLPCAANQTWSDNGSGVYSCVSLGTFYPAQTATCTPGTNVTSCTCATATCTSNRGSYTIVGGTATTGTIATLSWTAVAAAPVCTTSENGGVGFLGIGHSVATTTGMNITAGVAVTGLTITVDYNCVP
jgi:hypothetical protein